MLQAWHSRGRSGEKFIHIVQFWPLTWHIFSEYEDVFTFQNGCFLANVSNDERYRIQTFMKSCFLMCLMIRNSQTFINLLRVLLESSKQILPKHTSHLKRTSNKSYVFFPDKNTIPIKRQATKWWKCSGSTRTSYSGVFDECWGRRVSQWLFLVPLLGGRWYIITHLAICYLPPIRGTRSNHWASEMFDEFGGFVGEDMMLEHSFMLVCWYLVDISLVNLLETETHFYVIPKWFDFIFVGIVVFWWNIREGCLKIMAQFEIHIFSTSEIFVWRQISGQFT